MHLLILIDDLDLATCLCRALAEASHAVERGESVLDVARRAGAGRHYEVLLLGRRAAGLDGIDATRALRRRGVATPILLVGARLSVAYRVRALEAGADDAFAFRSASNELLARVRALGRRSAFVRRLSPAEDGAVLWPAHRLTQQAQRLTQRQEQVLHLIAAGMTDYQIAAHLHITHRTARFHVAAILLKLSAENRSPTTTPAPNI